MLEGTISGVRFKRGTAEFQNKSYVALGAVAELLLKHPSLRIEVIAHVAGQDDPEADMELSLARAQAVQAHLAEVGIGAGRIVPIGRGGEDPVADNATAAGRRANERVEIQLILGEIDR